MRKKRIILKSKTELAISILEKEIFLQLFSPTARHSHCQRHSSLVVGFLHNVLCEEDGHRFQVSFDSGFESSAQCISLQIQIHGGIVEY